MPPDAPSIEIELVFAELPVAAVLTDARGKLLATTAAAATLLRRAPDLVARVAALATLAISTTDTFRHGSETLRLTLVNDRSAEPDRRRVIFLTATTGDSDTDIDPLEQLTARQRETALLAATGLRTAELADRLGCTQRTVRAHLSACYRSLGVRSRLELVALIAGRQ